MHQLLLSAAVTPKEAPFSETSSSLQPLLQLMRGLFPRSLVVVNSSIVIVKTSHSIDEYSATIDGIMKWRASTFPNVPWGKLLNTKARAFLFDHQTALSVTQVGTLVVIKRLMDTWIPTAEIEMPRGWDGTSLMLELLLDSGLIVTYFAVLDLVCGPFVVAHLPCILQVIDAIV